MNRLFILFLVFFQFFTFFTSFGQKAIQMENVGGVYKIPCLVNGAKMKMIFDTGASNVSISKNMAEYLYENDYISEKDIKGTGKARVADGRIVDNLVINIKDLEIEGIHLENVEAWVSSELKAPLLLGQSAIRLLGPYEINGDILIIKNQSDDITDEEIESLFELASKYISQRLYNKAKDIYNQLYAIGVLSEYGKYQFANTCMLAKDPQKAKTIIDEINDYDYFNKNEINIYFLLGWIYESNHYLSEALAYYEMAFDFPSEDWKTKSNYASSMALLYMEKEDHYRACATLWIAINCLENHYGLPKQYILDDCLGMHKKNQKSYRDDNVDMWAYYYYVESELAGEITIEESATARAKLARNGNRHAIQYFNKINVDWNDLLY